MEIDKNKKRLRAIKDKFILFDTECSCCNRIFKFEKMWSVDRWGVNKKIFTWNYCHYCMDTKEDVLNEIDTDSCIFGIAWVDEHTITKKDNTKLKESLEEAKNSLIRSETKTSNNHNNPKIKKLTK